MSGATSSGKTTFLNLLIALIPKKERIISIEDIYELKIPHSNNVNLLPKDGNYDEILDFCMKSTPERLLLGELSTQNVHAVEKFITSGHKGFLMTMHADSPRQAITDTFFAKFPSSKKQNTSYEKESKLLAENIDLVIQLNHERNLTHFYFPKENKQYLFKEDEETFLKERLNIKSNKEQKQNLETTLKSNKALELKEFMQEHNLSYYKASKLVPKENLKKNKLKELVKENKNLTTHNIYKKLQQEGIQVSKTHIRRIRNDFR